MVFTCELFYNHVPLRSSYFACSLLHKQQVYPNSAVQSVGLCLRTLNLHSFSQTQHHQIMFITSYDVIKAAVAQFGGQLREELGQLMACTDLVHSCDESINSKDFLAESFGSDFEICMRSASRFRVGHSESLG